MSSKPKKCDLCEFCWGFHGTCKCSETTPEEQKPDEIITQEPEKTSVNEPDNREHCDGKKLILLQTSSSTPNNQNVAESANIKVNEPDRNAVCENTARSENGSCRNNGKGYRKPMIPIYLGFTIDNDESYSCACDFDRTLESNFLPNLQFNEHKDSPADMTDSESSSSTKDDQNDKFLDKIVSDMNKEITRGIDHGSGETLPEQLNDFVEESNPQKEPKLIEKDVLFSQAASQGAGLKRKIEEMGPKSTPPSKRSLKNKPSCAQD